MSSTSDLPRRAVLGGMATIGAAAALPQRAISAPAAPATDKLPIEFGCGLYDRMLALYTGEVKPEGIDLKYTPSTEARLLFDKVERGEYDVAEMSSSEYVARFSANKCPFVALPVFPSREFRHGYIIVNPRSAIKKPKDLEGKRIGVTLYTISAAIWIRGLLMEEYGVDLSKVRWVQGAVDTPTPWGNPKVMPLLKPVSIEANNTGKSLTQLLANQEIDAIVTANLPADFGRNPNVVRLFPNYHQIEREYFKRTHIFPIMHLVVIRKAVYDRNPWVAASLYKAFNESKEKAKGNLRDGAGTLAYMLPFLDSYIEETQAVFGDDCWPYGIEANRKTVETLVRYMVDQAMIKAPIPVERLFVKV